MTFQLPPVGGPSAGGPERTPGPDGSDRAARGARFAAALQTAGAARAAADGPPEEVMAQVAAAARRCDELAAQGRAVRFDDAAPGRVRIEVRDDAGRVTEALTPAQALDVALGRPVR